MNKLNKIIIIIILFAFSNKLNAQFGNEWIDYSKTYYKISAFNNRICNISQSALANAGIPSATNGSDFKLIKNGVEIPIFVSTNGVFSSSDYIEFQGTKATGNLDAEIYTLPSYQVNPNMNLMNDTSYYFLTIDNSTSHLRLISSPNIINNPPAKEDYCWDAIETNYKNVYVPGVDYNSSTQYTFESSRFEQAEGYVKSKVKNTSDSIVNTLTNLYKGAGAPNIVTSSIVLGYSYFGGHNVNLTINDVSMADSTFPGYGTTKFNSISFPTASMPANNVLRYKITSSNPSNDDVVGFSYLNIQYPKSYIFTNDSIKQFEIDAKPSTYYLEITGFKTGNLAPTLYDVTNNLVYTGDIAVANTIRFQLPPTSTKTKFILVSAINNCKTNITRLDPITFTDLSTANVQGNYVLLYPLDLVKNVSINNVLEYKKYRESSAGGSNKVSVVDFEQIYNQFGYGYNFHIAGVRRFLKYIKQKWSATAPDYIFIVGKGLQFLDYNNFYNDINIKNFKSVTPTFGYPGSDNVLVDLNFDAIPDFKVGRLDAFTNDEVKYYLDKVKEYEALAINSNNQIIDNAKWRKQVLHISGADDIALQYTITNAFNVQEPIIKGKYYGAKIKTVLKNSTDPISTLDNQEVTNMINDGIGLIQYFGHAASTTFAYALLDASAYKNSNGRYSIMIANGCDANNFYSYSNVRTLTDGFVLSPNTGSIAFIGSINNGYPDELARYTDTLYTTFADSNAQKSNLSGQVRSTITKIMSNPYQYGMMRPHTEQIQLHGDPTIKLNNFLLPDYAVEDKYLNTYPVNLNTSLDSFKINCQAFNLQKNTEDSIVMTIKRTMQSGMSVTYTKAFPKGIAWEDSMIITLPIDKVNGKGINYFEVKIDALNAITEAYETNNSFTKQIIIYDEDVVPIYPYDFSILHAPNTNPTLLVNTLNPFSALNNYYIQLDTTANFNSPFFKSTKISSIGGVLSWTPAAPMMDSVVYYWRCAKDTSATNPNFNWTMHSFVYLTNGSDGWNQSHYYQYLQDNFNGLQVDNNRNFNYTNKTAVLQITSCKMANPAPNNWTPFDFQATAEGIQLYTSSCVTFNPYTTVLHAIIYDTITGAPLQNVNLGGGLGLWGSNYCSRATHRFFQLPVYSTATRVRTMHFLDSIPKGYYVALVPFLNTTQLNANQFLDDTTTLGVGNTLYDKLKGLGFTMIDSFFRNKPWIFFYRPGMGATYVQQFMGKDTGDIIRNQAFYIPYKTNSGTMNSTVIGPSSKWNQFLKNGYARDGINTDTTSYTIYGMDSTNSETLIANVLGDTSLSFIDPHIYPKLRLVYNSLDSNARSAQQLHYWRVLFDPVADLAIAPNYNYSFADKYNEGQKAPLTFAIKNVSNIPMDSTDVKIYLQDKDQNKIQTFVKKIYPLKAFDTTSISVQFDTKGIAGADNLFINVNPNRKPNENTFGNNLAYKQFTVKGDNINPLIDVTFDGVRILKDDIVSSKPYIKIKLKDDNKYLRMDDSSLVKITLYDVNQTPRVINFNSDTIKFIPASANTGAENAAYIEYTPYFPIDGSYQLEVSAKDKTGNQSGAFSYKIPFQVINKQTVSNLLNYPNPFSTSTKFVFTLTGSKIPDNIKIQIMNITGKVVREITKPELGNLHIGKNITDYTWDGTDQFGDRLGNGVYFYRFITSDNGKSIENRAITDLNESKLFKRNMGKLVIIR